MLSGSISNNKLSNSSLTVTAGDGLSGGGGVNLGSSTTISVDVDDNSIEINENSLRVKQSGITNDMLNGSISNNKLSHNSITIGSTNVSLGSTITSLPGLNGVTIDGSSGLKVKNGNSGSGLIEIYENSDNGINKIKIIGQNTLDSDKTLTLPGNTGALISTGDSETITGSMLENTSVTSGSYGSTTEIPNFTVDSKKAV